MNSLDLWRLAERLSVVEAALLMCGADPGECKNQDSIADDPAQGPPGFAAAFAAIRGAKAVRIYMGDEDGNPPNADWFVPCWTKSFIGTENVRAWLESKGVRSGFFFPDRRPNLDYLDANDDRYAPKLAAAVSAWLAVMPMPNKSPKQLLEKWLRENAKDFAGLTDAEGNPVNLAIEECAKVANWGRKGGAPETGTSESSGSDRIPAANSKPKDAPAKNRSTTVASKQRK